MFNALTTLPYSTVRAKGGNDQGSSACDASTPLDRMQWHDEDV